MKSDTPLLGKRILFIGIGFYDYDEAIVSKLKEMGGDVSYLCSVVYTPYYRILKSMGLGRQAAKYAERVRKKRILQAPKNNDYIFIIKGEGLTQEDIDLIKTQNPNAKEILYFWDDVKRMDNCEVLLRNFTNIWSFDPEDCKTYGFNFRPLFYRDNLEAKPDKTIFLSSIGWCHSNRLEIFRRLARILKDDNKTYFLKLYLGKKRFLIDRYIKRNISSEDETLIIYKTIKYSEMMRLISASTCVLDIPHDSQRGLSIRTIEALRSGCHIITTNVTISCYTDIPSLFYTILPNDDFTSQVNELLHRHIPRSKISSHYSLESFLQDLFEEYEDIM